jgi:hypothetical protein
MSIAMSWRSAQGRKSDEKLPVFRNQRIQIWKLLGRNAGMFCDCELISGLFRFVFSMDWDIRVWELANSSDIRCVYPSHCSVACVPTVLHSWPVCTKLVTSGDTVLCPHHTAVQRLTPHFVFPSSCSMSRLGPWLPRLTLQTSNRVESYNGTLYASFRS